MLEKTAILPDVRVDEISTEVISFLDPSRNDDENELQNLINELSFTNPLSGLEYLSIKKNFVSLILNTT